MQSFKIEHPPITVVYGLDKDKGVSLTANMSIQTEGQEAGDKVSKATMAKYLKMFGVPEKKIEELLKATTKCQLCKTATKKGCSKCHVVYYCSKECQKNDWFIHKYFCGSTPLPKKVLGEKSIFGILLPENDINPIFVKVLLKQAQSGEKAIFLPDSQAIVGDVCGRKRVAYLPLMEKKPLPNTLEINFRQDFLNDRSSTNQTVENITKGKHIYEWRGPILILKHKHLKGFGELPEYIDMEMNDLYDVIAFFRLLGAKKKRKFFKIWE